MLSSAIKSGTHVKQKIGKYIAESHQPVERYDPLWHQPRVLLGDLLFAFQLLKVPSDITVPRSVYSLLLTKLLKCVFFLFVFI